MPDQGRRPGLEARTRAVGTGLSGLLCDDVSLGHHAPVAAVRAVVAVVAHRVALRNPATVPVVLAARCRSPHKSSFSRMSFRHAVDDTARCLAFLGDHALHERLVGVQRVMQQQRCHRAAARRCITSLFTIGQVLILERQRHALAFTLRPGTGTSRSARRRPPPTSASSHGRRSSLLPAKAVPRLVRRRIRVGLPVGFRLRRIIGLAAAYRREARRRVGARGCHFPGVRS